MRYFYRFLLTIFIILIAILVIQYLPYVLMVVFTLIAIFEYMLLNWIYKESKKL
jgi:hypothetical protein